MYIVSVYTKEDARNGKRFNKKNLSFWSWPTLYCNGKQCFHLQTKKYTY
jgi:hypothetical protein